MAVMTVLSYTQGKAVYFVSNNSSKSRQGYLQKFITLGIEAYEVWCSVFFLG